MSNPAPQSDETLDKLLSNLVNDITISGYGKEDEPNDLIEKDDEQPFAGYRYHQKQAKLAIAAYIDGIVQDVIETSQPKGVDSTCAALFSFAQHVNYQIIKKARGLPHLSTEEESE